MKALPILLSLTAILSSGCVITPSLDDVQELAPQCPTTHDSCLALDMPPPLAENVYISIEPGKQPKANAGGEQLIRSYIDIRKRISQWQKSPS